MQFPSTKCKETGTTDGDLPQGRMLTEEEDRQIKENLAQRNFGMRLVEFTKAWKSGALLDRLTHHVHIIEMNGDSYRLRQSGRPASE